MNRVLKITILSSTEDIASTNIMKQLLTHFNFTQLENRGLWESKKILSLHTLKFVEPSYSVEFTLIQLDNIKMIELDTYFPSDTPFGDLLIFASRHKAETISDHLSGRRFLRY